MNFLVLFAICFVVSSMADAGAEAEAEAESESAPGRLVGSGGNGLYSDHNGYGRGHTVGNSMYGRPSSAGYEPNIGFGSRVGGKFGIEHGSGHKGGSGGRHGDVQRGFDGHTLSGHGTQFEGFGNGHLGYERGLGGGFGTVGGGFGARHGLLGGYGVDLGRFGGGVGGVHVIGYGNGIGSGFGGGNGFVGENGYVGGGFVGGFRNGIRFPRINGIRDGISNRVFGHDNVIGYVQNHGGHFQAVPYPVHSLLVPASRYEIIFQRNYPVRGYNTATLNEAHPVVHGYKTDVLKHTHPVSHGYKTEVHKEVHPVSRHVQQNSHSSHH